jgi:hypothetical protein
MSEAGLEKFTADNPWIFDLISYFDGDTPQIPWGSVSINGSYTRYMIPTYQSAEKAILSLNLEKVPTSREATQATKELFDQTRGTWDKISSMGMIAWESAFGGMPVVREVLATFSASAFLQLKQGFDLHASGIAKEYLRDTELRVAQRLQSGDITRNEAVSIIKNTEQALQNHATTIQEGLGALAYMDKEGWFETQQLNGLGAVPILGAVLGIVAIAAAALVIVAVYQISTVNSLIREECSKFQDEKYRLACMSEMSKALPQIDFGAITGQITKWIVLGLLVAGGVYFAPVIARSAMGARRELKAAT